MDAIAVFAMLALVVGIARAAIWALERESRARAPRAVRAVSRQTGHRPATPATAAARQTPPGRPGSPQSTETVAAAALDAIVDGDAGDDEPRYAPPQRAAFSFAVRGSGYRGDQVAEHGYVVGGAPRVERDHGPFADLPAHAEASDANGGSGDSGSGWYFDD